MSDFYTEALYRVITSLKCDTQLMSNLKGINKLKESIDDNTRIQIAMFLYENGNLNASEKKEILEDVKKYYNNKKNAKKLTRF